MSDLTHILPMIPGFIIGLTFHEFSHALAADRCGDPTARQVGRLTLNPIAHLDVIGSLALIFAGFGWAKPVPVNFFNLRHPRRDMMIVALAGPLSNIVLAIAFSIILRILWISGLASEGTLSVLLLVFVQAIWINVILAVFNLIPLPPLDGSRVLAGIIPPEWNHGFEEIERFGPMILLGLMVLASVTGVSILGRIIMPVAQPVFNLVLGDWLFH